MVATFLSSIDDDALKVYNGFQFGTPERDRSVSEIIAQFERYSIGETNETYERFVFNNRQQNEGETFESFLASIRLLIRSCNYCDSCTPSILQDRIVLGVRSTSLQTALLKEGKLNLKTVIDICKASENATIQHEQMKGDYQEYEPRQTCAMFVMVTISNPDSVYVTAQRCSSRAAAAHGFSRTMPRPIQRTSPNTWCRRCLEATRCG